MRPPVIHRIIGAIARSNETMRFRSLAMRRPTVLCLGPQEAYELLSHPAAVGVFDPDGVKLFGLTIHVTSEPGVAVA